MKPARNTRLIALLSSILVIASAASLRAQNVAPHGPLRIYFVDVEGGQATLFVTPMGQSLLIDTGWPDNQDRDARRIVAAAKDAGIKKIDYVLITHFHEDHVGGVPQLAAMIPIGTFIDHGENRETSGSDTARYYQIYLRELARRHYPRDVVHPGEHLPIQGIDAQVLTADGAVIDHPMPGAGAANPACNGGKAPAADKTENARSVGTLFTFGKLKILDLGDLTMDKERDLMCPNNKIGNVDIYIVSHHGWLQSGSRALVEGIHPRVAIMDNGEKKGGSPSAWDIIHQTPGLQDLWQLHYSDEGGAEHNVQPQFIANLPGPDTGNYLKLTAWPDGHFAVFNARTKKTKTYPAR